MKNIYIRLSKINFNFLLSNFRIIFLLDEEQQKIDDKI